MDGQSYTFAAAGEFTLLDIRSSQNSPLFTLQGRLGPEHWPATVVKALAFGIPGVEAYQVCSLNVYVMARFTTADWVLSWSDKSAFRIREPTFPPKLKQIFLQS